MNCKKIAILLACLGFSSSLLGCDEESGGFTLTCTPGSTRCNMDVVETCIGVNWAQTLDCSALGQTCNNSACSGGAVCNANDSKCLDDGQLMTCKDGKYELSSCPEGQTCPGGATSCTGNATQVTCTEGTKQCNADKTGYQTCTSAQWSDVTLCGENQECTGAGDCTDKADVTVSDCNAGDIKCSDDNMGTQTCNESGNWSDAVPCGDGQICNSETKTCETVDVPPCTNGEKKCDNNVAMVCNEGTWTTETCEAPQICDNGECTDPAPTETCTDDELKCSDDGTTLLKCASNVWNTEKVCTETEGSVCQDNACTEVVPEPTKECTYNADAAKNEIKCQSEGTGIVPGNYYSCLTDGTWSSTTTECAKDTPICDKSGAPNACVTTCKDGTKRCSGDGVPQTCVLGHWVNGMTCGTAETCVDGACVCTPNETRCETAGIFQSATGKIQTCKDDKTWDKAKDCENNNQTCDPSQNKCVDKCKKDDVRCDADGNFQICSNAGVWETKAVCGAADQCNDKDKDKYGCACQDKETKCDGDTILKCDNHKAPVKYNTWKEEKKCTSGVCEIQDNAATCSCTVGTTWCNGDKLGTCVEEKGKKTPKEDKCKAGNTCSEDLGGVCATKVCDKIKKVFCEGNQIVSCTDEGQYHVEKTCAADELCSETIDNANCEKPKGDALCIALQKRCLGQVVQKCDNNLKWADETDCAKDAEKTLCFAENDYKVECVKPVCDSLTLQCDKDNKKIQICEKNAWKDVADCGAAGLKCSDGMCQQP